jgi:predicted DNA-binding protein (MmcQ/YjbR family)
MSVGSEEAWFTSITALAPDGDGNAAAAGHIRRARGKAPKPHRRGAMNSDGLRDHCLLFTGAEETFPFGPQTSVFKVGGKMFAVSQLGADSLRVGLKCEPALAGALRETHAAVIPGYHLNKRHWNTVILDGSLPDGTIRDMIEDSYDLVVSKLPRAARRALSWHGDA